MMSISSHIDQYFLFRIDVILLSHLIIHLKGKVVLRILTPRYRLSLLLSIH